MKTYTAFLNKNSVCAIISVRAENEEAARLEVQDQLDRPGRYSTLVAWVNGGKIVIEKTETQS